MKKGVLYIIMVLTCVSCYVAGYDADYLYSSRKLEDHALGTLNNNLCKANKVFCLLQCADMYLAYDGEDRDLQWFAEYVYASREGNRIVCKYGSSTMTVYTNGKTFSEPGAIYKVGGDDGLVFQCISETAWIVESRYMQAELEITSSEILRLEYTWKGSGTEPGVNDDKLIAKYNFDIGFYWYYRNNPVDLYISWLQSKDMISSGRFHYTVEHDGKEIDWLDCTLTGRNISMTTSRN